MVFYKNLLTYNAYLLLTLNCFLLQKVPNVQNFTKSDDALSVNMLRQKYVLYNSEQDILDNIESHKVDSLVEVNTILERYHSCFKQNDTELSNHHRPPFIIIEGNNIKLRGLIATKLVNMLNAKRLSIPGQCLYDVVPKLSKGSTLKNAFFSLSLYHVAYDARRLLNEGNIVICNGYWSDQQAYKIGKIFKRPRDLPVRGDLIYAFPKDLTKPDLVVYLSYDGQREYCTVPNPQWIPKKVLIYDKFVDLPLLIIPSANTIERISEKILQELRDGLGVDLDII